MAMKQERLLFVGFRISGRGGEDRECHCNDVRVESLRLSSSER